MYININSDFHLYHKMDSSSLNLTYNLIDPLVKDQ